MPFIRVKSSVTGHEFDVSPGRLSAHPEWSVVDAEPVKVQRPAEHGKPSKRAKAAAEPEAEHTPEPVEPVEFPRFSQSSAPETD